MEIDLDLLCEADWPRVREIYLEGIATGNATFETSAPEWEKWNAAHRADCRIIARRKGAIVGWAALSPVSTRKAYAGIAEVSVYVAGVTRGTGIGRLLLAKLIEDSENAGI